MENLFSETVSDLLKDQSTDTTDAQQGFTRDLERMIEVGILQDYLEIFGKMEDN